MSARPDIRRLSDEDLDLLLSRFLDGDLAPEEERELQEFLTDDPRAARRLEELTTLVGRLKALPDPAPPLGLTARVNAHTAERSKGMGALWHRVGIFPPPSMVRGIAALFAIVLIGISVLKTQSEQQKAEERAAFSDDGRVPVFIGERPASPVPPARPAAPPVAAKKALEPKALAEKAAGAKDELSRRDAPAEMKTADNARPSREEGKADLPLSEQATGSAADAPAAAGSLRSRAEPAPEAAARRADAGIFQKSKLAASADTLAPAPPAARPLSWSIRVVSSDGWVLKRAPESVPSTAVSARLLVTLDASGHVVEVRPAEGGPLSPEVEALARGLLFESASPAPSGASRPVLEVQIGTR